MDKVYGIINEALKADGDTKQFPTPENRFTAYKLYVSSVKMIFEHLENDLNSYNCTVKFKEDLNHHSKLINCAENCIQNCKKQIKPIQQLDNNARSLTQPKLHDKLCPKLSSLPCRQFIDILLAEKPANPIDEAKLKIQKMIQSTNKMTSSNRLTSNQRATMQMSLRREIEVTLTIARKKEEELCKTKTNELEQFQSVLEYEVNHYPVLKMNPEIQEVYRSSQKFYHHILKDSKWYNLAQTSRTPVESCTLFILRMNNAHPITEFMERKIITIISAPVDSDQIKASLSYFVKNLQNLACVFCLLGTSGSTNSRLDAQENVFNLLVDYVFRNEKLVTFVYNYLFADFIEEHKQYNENLHYLETTSQAETLLPENIRNKPDIVDALKETAKKMVSLRKIYNPVEKVNQLSKMIQELTQYISQLDPGAEIGGDELMPIFIYICVQCKSFEIFLHTKYCELLMPDNFLMGMEGYVLTSMQAALEFCVCKSQFQQKLQ